MLSIIHNGKEEQLEFNGTTLQDLTVSLLEYVNKQSKVVADIIINGESVSSGLSIDDYKITENDNIELISEKPEIMTINSIEEILSQFPLFREKVDNIVNLLVEGSKEKSYREFNSLLMNINDLIQFLQTLEQLFKIDYSKLEVGSGTAIDFISSLTVNLTEVRDAMKNEDQVSLSDLLEYEIKEVFADDGDFAGLMRAITSLLRNG